MTPYETKDELAPVKPNPVDVSFREFRDQLYADGWFKRSVVSELALLLPIVTMLVVGTCIAWTYPLTAILLLAVAQQQAGWLGHDMVHARNSSYCEAMVT